MKINYFMDYHDCNPKDSSLEEIARIIREDASIKDRTEKHRYYLSQGLAKAATNEKHSCLCFSVATLFKGGKTQKHIAGWPYIGMVDFDDLDSDQVHALAEKARQDKHTLMVYVTISGKGIRILFRYFITGSSLGLTDVQQKLVYEEAFQRANRHYRKLLGAEPDPKCKTCTQLSGVAHDPKVYYQPESIPFYVEKDYVLTHAQERKTAQKRLRQAVKASEKQLADEGVVFAPGSHNEYVMRLGYLLNAYGIPENDAYSWAVDHYSDEYDGDIYAIIQSCYKHTDEHGSRKLPKRTQDSGGVSYASVTEIEQFIESQVSVRYNVIRRQCEIAWKEKGTPGSYVPITDRDENSLWCRMKKDGTEVRLPDICHVLQSEFVPMFHPFEDYFGSLPEWDGVDHIGQLARTVHVKGDTELFVEHFRKWFVGIVATLLDERSVNHEILVFIGEQGNFKSTFFSLLLPPPLQMYFHVKMNHQHLTKDDMLTLSEFALICLEEIDELKNADLNQLKAMVTAKDISERAAYARNKEHRKHIASFCGTGNNPNFLTDPTGNRRWLVWQVEDIDNPHDHPFCYTGIYSQALALWKSGFRYWFDQSEIQQLNVLNREFESARPEEELLLTYFRPPFKGSKPLFMKVSEILERINVGIHQPLSPHRLGIMLKRLGFTKCKYNGERGYLVVERSGEEIQASRKIAGNELSGN